jgi:hypothetical protein
VPFNASIPQATDRLAKSQQDLLQNNQQLDTSFGINHFAFSDPTAFNGMHKQVDLANGADATVPPFTDTLYTKIAGIGPASTGELFYRRFGGAPIQMTGPFEPSLGNKGYTFLPGGMLLQWGFINSTSSSFTQLLFATNNRNFQTKCIFISTQPYSLTDVDDSVPASQATVTIQDTSVSTTGFKWAFVTSSNKYTGFYWQAIGF